MQGNPFLPIWPFRTKSITTVADDDTAILEVISGASTTYVDPMTVPPVVAAIQTIAGSAATLDIHLVRRDDAAADVKHHTLDLLRGQVNDWTSGSQLIYDLLAAALTRDAGRPAWVNRVDGKVREIIHFSPGVIRDQKADSGERLYRMYGRAVPASDILHVIPPLGKAPTTLAARSISAAAAINKHIERFFNNSAKVGGVIEMPTSVGPQAEARMKQGWRAAHEGGDNAGRTAILHGNATFRPLVMTSTDAQTVETLRWILEDIARAFNINAVMLGDLSRSSYANAWQKNREFMSITLMPWLTLLQDAFNRALLNDEERRTLTFKFDVEDLTRVDLEKRAVAIASLISSRVLSPNEARTWLDSGLKPFEGGDEHVNPFTGSNQPPRVQAEVQRDEQI